MSKLIRDDSFKNSQETQVKIGEFTLIPGFIDTEGSESLADFGGRKLTLIKSHIPKKDRSLLEILVRDNGFVKEIKYWEEWYFR